MAGGVGEYPGARIARLVGGLAGLAAAALLWTGGLAVAAPSQPGAVQPSRESLDPSQRTEPTGPRRNEDLFARPEAGPCPLAGSALRFTLRRLTFDGVEAEAGARLADEFDGDVGRELGLADVCRIRDAANFSLFRRGLLARVEIPEQTIRDGALTLRVIAAHVVSVQVRGDAGPAQDQVERYLDRLRGMRPFDMRKAQRYLLLASDVPGVRISASLRAAAEGAGAVDLLVTVSRAPVDAIVNVQNLGARSVGRFGTVGRVDLNGFTSFGERTTLVVFAGSPVSEQSIYQLMSEARLGDSGLLGSGSLTYASSSPGAELKPLELEGRSFVANLGLSYPVIRSRRRNLNVGGGVDIIDQRTRIARTVLLSEDHLRVVYAHLDADQQWRGDGVLIPDGTIAVTVDGRQGLRGWGASNLADPTLSRIGGRPDASLIRGSARMDLRPMDGLVLRSSVLGQYSAQSLLAYEQFAVGNLTVGRGYDPASLTGDSGVGGAFEARVGPFALPKLAGRDLRATLLGFYDVAHVSERAPLSDRRTAHSAGVGATFELSRTARLDITWARPENKTSRYLPTLPTTRLLVNLTATVF